MKQIIHHRHQKPPGPRLAPRSRLQMFVSAMEQPHTEQNRNDPPACLNDVPENRTDRTVTEKKKNDRTIPGQSVGQRIFAQRKTEPTLQQTGKRQNPKNEIHQSGNGGGIGNQRTSAHLQNQFRFDHITDRIGHQHECQPESRPPGDPSTGKIHADRRDGAENNRNPLQEMQRRPRQQHGEKRQYDDLQPQKRGETRRFHLTKRLKKTVLSGDKRKHAQQHQQGKVPSSRISGERHHQRNGQRPEHPHNQLRKHHQRKRSPVPVYENTGKYIRTRLQQCGAEPADNSDQHDDSPGISSSPSPIFRGVQGPDNVPASPPSSPSSPEEGGRRTFSFAQYTTAFFKRQILIFCICYA